MTRGRLLTLQFFAFGLFSIKRKHNAAQYIESVNGILVPAFVFIVEDIVHLEPQVQRPGYFKFNTGIYVHARLPFEITVPGSNFAAIRSAAITIQITFQKKILEQLPAQTAGYF